MSDALERAVGDFRRWFAEALASGDAPADAPPSIDLAGLLGHFVALRQEVNLQTRSVRAQQEQNAETLARLGQAVEGAAASARAASPSDDGQRPLLLSLIELFDALSLAAKEIVRTRENLLPWLEDLATEDAPSPSRWSRWFGAKPTGDPGRRDKVGRIRAAIESLITGYGMGLERIERSLRQHGLEPIASVGKPFDPERMEVLEGVANSGRPTGEVLDEVRRGYLRGGRVFRCALVRVARG